MTPTVRRLTPADADAARALWREAFGTDDADDRSDILDLPGRRFWGTEVEGTLAAVAIDREFESWFGGRRVQTAGIAGVTVAAEHRGSGLLRPVFDAMLAGARQRGAVISALYPTGAGIYRSLGYAPVAALDDIQVPTHHLLVPGDTVPVRRATVEDVPGIRAAYETWARDHHGPLTREGTSFPRTDEELLQAPTGITVAEPSPGHISGYVSWHRGTGYGTEGPHGEARLRVDDLVALDRTSLVSLLRMLGSFAAVTPSTIIRTSGRAEWRQLLRADETRTLIHRPYLVAVLDVQALAHLTAPPGLTARLPFTTPQGAHLLTVADGNVSVGAGDGSGRSLDPDGLAMTFAGSADSATLRRLGHLDGDDSDDPVWDALTVGRPPAVLDYY